MRKIMIDYVHPPIPIRCFDYVAFWDGDEEGKRGFGSTERSAVQELIDQIED